MKVVNAVCVGHKGVDPSPAHIPLFMFTNPLKPAVVTVTAGADDERFLYTLRQSGKQTNKHDSLSGSSAVSSSHVANTKTQQENLFFILF